MLAVVVVVIEAVVANEFGTDVAVGNRGVCFAVLRFVAVVFFFEVVSKVSKVEMTSDVGKIS